MFSRDQIPPNNHLSNSITVVVQDISQSSNEKVDYEIIVEDVDGYAIPLKI
jgi:hypothetical protein